MGLAWMTAKSCAWCRIMNSCGQKSAACMCIPFILILLPLFTTVFTFSSKFQYDFIMITFLLSNQVLFMQSDWCKDKILMNLLLVFVIKLQQKSNRHFQQELKTVWIICRHAWFESSLGFGIGQKGRNGWINCWYIVTLAINKVDSCQYVAFSSWLMIIWLL